MEVLDIEGLQNRRSKKMIIIVSLFTLLFCLPVFSSQNLWTKAVKDNKQTSGKNAQLELHGRINFFTLTKSQTYRFTNAQTINIFLKGT